MVLRRAVKVSLCALGPRDRRRLAALLQAYRGAVNFFLRLLWREPGAGFDTKTSKRLERTRLSARYRDQALKQATELVSATRKSAAALGVQAGRPHFRGMAVLDAKFVRFAPGDDEHDLVIRLSCLNKGKPLEIRSKRTRVLKKWLARPGARLVAGCGLGDGELLTLWVELPEPGKRESGPVLGVDVGVTNLLATSEGEFLGTDFRDVRDKIRRRRPGSKGRRRARRERDDLVCASVKRLPWSEVRAVAYEDLTGIKRGKKPGRGKPFRKAVAAWRPPLVEQRLTCLAVEQGVFAVPVPARGNSTTCTLCGHRSRKNRRGSLFLCLGCGFQDDADHVGAVAAKRRGEELLAGTIEAWQEERQRAEAKREGRRAAARKRGQATAEKWRAKRRAEEARQEVRRTATTEEKRPVQQGSAVSGGSDSGGAARQLPVESAPVRDPSRGGAPYENPEGGDPRRRRKTAGDTAQSHRHGLRLDPGDNCQVRSQDSRVLALDRFSDKP